METLLIITIGLYLLSTTAYLIYLLYQKNLLQHIGFYVMTAGFLLHSAGIATAFVMRGYFPVQNLYETLSIAAWALAGVFLILQCRFNLRILGVYAAPLVSLIMIAAYRLPREALAVQAIFNNIWVIAHVIAIFLGNAAFALACGAGLIYLLQEQGIKSKKRGFFFRRLPSLELIDATGYGCVVVGFTMLTIGLITGFVYAKTLWGRFWDWDPKEVWSGITWLLYAALLHGRLTLGWRGRKAAIMAIIGFAVLLFTFLGVNFLLKGHHGEFTKF